MRFALLTPGTGSFYCGSCLRDDVLGHALERRGHDVQVVPLYLPRVLEVPAGDEAVHMGGINMYLQQKSRLASRLPRFLADLLDRPGLLRWAARRGGMTQASALGAMTVSMLRGERGHQAAELDKLVRWMEEQPRPDVIVLSNAMLIGVARRLKEALGSAVVVTLQGEAPFLDALPEPYRRDAWAEIGGRAGGIDAFVPVSGWYGTLMRERLRLPAERVHVVHNGLDLTGFEDPPPLAGRHPKTIGYLARMCADKGLPTLVEAFIRLKQRASVPGLRLGVAGAMLPEDRPLVHGLQRRLARHGHADDVAFEPDIDRARKHAWLRTLSVLSVPATYGESFGLYVLEALAAGVPVVQPRHGAFPELLEATGGGLLCDPDDAIALADGLEQLLTGGSGGQDLADRGRARVFERFTAAAMAEGVAAVCRPILR